MASLSDSTRWQHKRKVWNLPAQTPQQHIQLASLEELHKQAMDLIEAGRGDAVLAKYLRERS